MKTSVMVLLIMPRTRRSRLLEQLEYCTRDVLAVCNCKEARDILRTNLPIRVVVSDISLPDGDWRDVLMDIRQTKEHAELVVWMSAFDRESRREALEKGAYDVLTDVSSEQETVRVVRTAAVRSEMRSFSVQLARTA